MKCDAVKQIYVPQYEGLSVATMQHQALKYPEVADYLPDAKELPKVPRQWLANVIYSVAGQPFADWVDEVIASRNSKISANEKKHILMDPDVFAAFEASTQVSSKCTTLLLVLTRVFCCARSCEWKRRRHAESRHKT